MSSMQPIWSPYGETEERVFLPVLPQRTARPGPTESPSWQYDSNCRPGHSAAPGSKGQPSSWSAAPGPLVGTCYQGCKRTHQQSPYAPVVGRHVWVVLTEGRTCSSVHWCSSLELCFHQTTFWLQWTEIDSNLSWRSAVGRMVRISDARTVYF